MSSNVAYFPVILESVKKMDKLCIFVFNCLFFYNLHKLQKKASFLSQQSKNNIMYTIDKCMVLFCIFVFSNKYWVVHIHTDWFNTVQDV